MFPKQAVELPSRANEPVMKVQDFLVRVYFQNPSIRFYIYSHGVCGIIFENCFKLGLIL